MDLTDCLMLLCMLKNESQDSELMCDMINMVHDTACGVIERVSKYFPIDKIARHEHFVEKVGPLEGLRNGSRNYPIFNGQGKRNNPHFRRHRR